MTNSQYEPSPIHGWLAWHELSILVLGLLGGQSSLRANGDERLADSRLKDLVRLVETFGFYLCSLDVRQESTVHCEVSPANLKAESHPLAAPVQPDA